jgi:hypothetical protein
MTRRAVAMLWATRGQGCHRPRHLPSRRHRGVLTTPVTTAAANQPMPGAGSSRDHRAQSGQHRVGRTACLVISYTIDMHVLTRLVSLPSSLCACACMKSSHDGSTLCWRHRSTHGRSPDAAPGWPSETRKRTSMKAPSTQSAAAPRRSSGDAPSAWRKKRQQRSRTPPLSSICWLPGLMSSVPESLPFQARCRKSMKHTRRSASGAESLGQPSQSASVLSIRRRPLAITSERDKHLRRVMSSERAGSLFHPPPQSRLASVETAFSSSACRAPLPPSWHTVPSALS